jgi:hypothetical protein
VSKSDLVSDTTTIDERGNRVRVRVFENGTRITSCEIRGFQMVIPPSKSRRPEMTRVSARQLDLLLDDATANEQEELISRWDAQWS